MSPWWGNTLKWSRTFHIYLTLVAMVTLLFFGVTGFVMNHTEWFSSGEQTVAVESAVLSPAAISAAVSGNHLPLVEELRAHHGAEGEATVNVAKAAQEEDGKSKDVVASITVQFRAPGRKTDVRMDGDLGPAEITRSTTGLYGVVSDMHRGQNTGRAWKLVIDATAILVVLGVLTGFVLWLGMKRRRIYGLIGLGLSAALGAAVFWLAVR